MEFGLGGKRAGSGGKLVGSGGKLVGSGGKLVGLGGRGKWGWGRSRPELPLAGTLTCNKSICF